MRGVVIIGVIIFGLVALTNRDDGNADSGDSDWGRGSASDTSSGFTAEVMCEEFVKERLRSPGSAEFSEQEHRGSDPRWTVTGVVDSENAFGALLRSNYRCDLTYVGNDRWRARDVVVVE